MYIFVKKLKLNQNQVPKWTVYMCWPFTCLFLSHPKKESETFPFTNKPSHATEILAAFLICAWIQIKSLWSCVAAGVSAGRLTTVKEHLYQLSVYTEYLGWNQCRLDMFICSVYYSKHIHCHGPVFIKSMVWPRRRAANQLLAVLMIQIEQVQAWHISLHDEQWKWNLNTTNTVK